MSKQTRISVNEARSLLREYSEALEVLAEATAKSVVRVGPHGDWGWRGGGTGFVSGPDGLIVTADHVVRRTRTPRISMIEGKSYEAKIIGRDPFTDVAVLKIDAPRLEPLPLGDSDRLKLGQLVIAVSNPRGVQPSVTAGIISGVGRSFQGWWGRTIEDTVISDIALYPGSSGGPLVNADGEVVGLNIATFPPARSISVPSRTVKSVTEQLVTEGRVRRAYLGIAGQPLPLTGRQAEKSGLKQESGVILYSVEDDSPADKAGLNIGDILVDFDGKKVEDLDDLHKSLGPNLIAKAVEVRIVRTGQLLTLKITPTELSQQ